jgi:hypothetical protein
MYKQINEQQHHFDYWTVREQFITTCMNGTLACIYIANVTISMNNLENISKRNGQTDILNNVDINLFHINIHKLVTCLDIGNK